MNKNFKCVAFDLDGTLIDSGPDLLDSLNFVLQKNNLNTINSNIIGNLVGGGAEAMIRRGYAYLNKKLDEKIIPGLINQFLEYYESNCTKKTKLYPNILDILKSLQEKEIKICICTNKRQYLAKKIIKELQINDFFDVIVGSQKSVQLKPSTEMLEIFLKKLLLKPKDVIFIGDSTNDIIPANILGMTSVYVKYGYGKIKESDKADFQISNAKELENFF
jgi:phosphoglycolate phosphatase